MIYRTQVVDLDKKSLNPLISKQRKQKYKTHLSRIFEIQSRIIKSKPKQEAKKVQQKIQELTKLKEFTRNFKEKEEQLQRNRTNLIMLEHIKQRMHANTFSDLKLRKTKSSLKLSRPLHQKSQKKLADTEIDQQIKQQNRRLLKSISQKSFDQDRFRQTLRSSTKDYLKLRNHMRRMKSNRSSVKKLRTEPSDMASFNPNPNQETFQSTYHKISSNRQYKQYERIQSMEMKQIKFDSNLRSNISHQTLSVLIKPKQSRIKLTHNQMVTAISKKLKNIQ